MSIITEPNLPNKDVSIVIVDNKTPLDAVETLKSMNITVYKTKRCGSLYSAVDGHPDMVLCHIYGACFVCEPEFHSYYNELLPNADIVQGSTHITGTYPYDTAYNIARVGKYAICNVPYTDSKIIEYLERYGVKIINVRQGYSKCSICVIDENSIITADKGIALAAENVGMDVLLINPGGVDLPPLNYGFIGGCTGKIAKNKLAVCGDLKYHPDFDRIFNFCREKHVDIVPLADMHPFDIGTVIPVE